MPPTVAKKMLAPADKYACSVQTDDVCVDLEEAPPAFDGRVHYGDSIAFEESFVGNSVSHWHQRVLVARRRGIAVGALLITQGPESGFIDHPVVGEYIYAKGVEPGQNPPISATTFIGSISRHYGGGLVVQQDPLDAEKVLSALAHEAARLYRGEVAVVPNLPHDQVPAFLTAGFRNASPEAHRIWHEIHLPPVSDTETFLSLLNAGQRRAWKLDLALKPKLSAQLSAEPFSLASHPEAPALIASVRDRHGESTHPLLIEYALRQWRGRSDTQALAFCARDPNGNLIGLVLAKLYGDRIDLHDVGIIDHPQRGEIYRALVFAEPLKYAVENGLTRIILGVGHDGPKRLRSSIGTVVHTLKGVNDSQPGAPLPERGCSDD